MNYPVIAFGCLFAFMGIAGFHSFHSQFGAWVIVSACAFVIDGIVSIVAGIMDYKRK
jgi:hypothetical protein